MPTKGHVYRTEGIILRRHNLGEADRILTLFTRDYGKLRVVAKGARRPTSRKAGSVELFTRVDIVVSKGRTLDVVSQVDIVEVYLPLRTNLIMTTYASHFVELLDAFSEEGDESRELYHLAVEGLGWLSTAPDPALTARYFELHLLDVTGFRPELMHCVISGTPIEPENQFFSVVGGGVVSPEAAQYRSGLYPLSLNALKVLRHFQRTPYHGTRNLKISPGVHREVERVLHATISYYLERRLKSTSFLKRLQREERFNAERNPDDQE